MKMSKVLIVTMAGVGVAGWGMAAHADAKAKFAADCAECHEAGDFAGEDVMGLTDSIKKIAAGQMKHKGKITLSDADIAAVATYMSTGK